MILFHICTKFKMFSNGYHAVFCVMGHIFFFLLIFLRDSTSINLCKHSNLCLGCAQPPFIKICRNNSNGSLYSCLEWCPSKHVRCEMHLFIYNWSHTQTGKKKNFVWSSKVDNLYSGHLNFGFNCPVIGCVSSSNPSPERSLSFPHSLISRIISFYHH